MFATKVVRRILRHSFLIAVLFAVLSTSDAFAQQVQPADIQDEEIQVAKIIDSGRVKFHLDAFGKVSQIDVNAKNPPRAARSSSRPGSVRLADAATDPVGVAQNFLRSFGRAWVNDPASELLTQRVESDRHGQRVRMGQVYNSIRVVGSQIVVDLAQNGLVKRAHGSAIKLRNVPELNPSISANDAQQVASKLWAESEVMPGEVQGNELVLVSPSFLDGAPSSDHHTFLAYEIEMDAHPTGGFIYYIDAHKGELRHRISTTHGAGPLNRLIYDCTPYVYGLGACYWNLTRNGYHYGRYEPDPGSWGINPYYQAFDVDVMYDEFVPLHNWVFDQYGRNGGNNQNGTLDPILGNPQWSTAYVYSDANPSWGPNCLSASFSRGRLNFCRGALVPHVTGHEYAHSFTYFAHPPNGQTYSGISASLDESQAYVFGEMFERYRNASADWIGGVPGSDYIINLGNPTTSRYGPSGPHYPNRYYSPNFVCGTDPTARYNNAAVPSYGAYLASRGGSFNGCTIAGIGEAAVERILYRAVTACYPTTPTFLNAYNCQVNACNDLYGANSQTCYRFAKALQAVELNQPGLCSGVARVTPICALKPSSRFLVTHISRPIPRENPPLPFKLHNEPRANTVWVPNASTPAEPTQFTIRVSNSGPGVLEFGTLNLSEGITVKPYPQILASGQEADLVFHVSSLTARKFIVVIPTNDPAIENLKFKVVVGG